MTEQEKTAQHAAEAQERWGETDAYKESARRTKGYSDDDWATIKAEAEGIEMGLAAALTEGDAPDSQRAMDLAEAWREHIGRWFYPCSHEMLMGLSQMYTGDPRFKEHYEERAEGLAEYLAEAIRANAARA